MRIVYVLTSLGVGGAEKQVIGLAERMAARGHQILLVVLKAQLREEWPTKLEKRYLNLRKNPLEIMRGLMAARKIFEEFKPELVHSHTFPANLFARLLKMISRPFLLMGTIHNVYEGGWWRMLAYRLTDGLAEGMTAVSGAAAERFVRLKAVRKLHVVTNGIELDEFAREKFQHGDLRKDFGGERGFVWLAVGRLSLAKDIENLLRAFAIVRAKRGEARLWIAGEDFEGVCERLKRRAAELGVDDAVRWLGLRRDVAELMANADGFVLSSAWEGMPLVVGEAMACGMPVVATDVGGVREIVGECGEIVPAKDALKLAAGMNSVMEMSEKERRELGVRARERVQREFSMDERVEEWERLYENEIAEYGEAHSQVCLAKFAVPVLVAGVLRLGLLVAAMLRTGTNVITSGDTLSYLVPGMNLLREGRFSNALGAEIDRTPGYPIFLAVFGEHVSVFGEHGAVAAVIAQILVAMLSVLIVIRIARRVYSKSDSRNQIALISGWIFAVEPLAVVFSVRLLPETLFVLFLLLAIERLIGFLETEKLATIAWSAVWLVVATFVRPVGYYLIPLIAIGMAVVMMRKRGLRWQAPLLMMAIALPLLGAWQVRNFVETRFGGFSTVAEKNLYFFQAAGVRADWEGRRLEDVQAELGYADEDAYLKAQPAQSGWSQGERADFERREALRVLKEHPVLAFELQLKGAAIVALTPGAADFLKMIGEYPEDAPERVVGKNLTEQSAELGRAHFGVALVMVCFELILLGIFCFAALGILRPEIGNSTKALFIGLILYFVLVSGGVQAVGRYRLPVMPVLIILAAGGVQWVGNKLTTKRFQ